MPRSFSGPLVDVLFKITGKYIQPSRQWLQTLLSTVSVHAGHHAIYILICNLSCHRTDFPLRW